MAKIKDLTGQRFGKLVVKKLSERRTKSGGAIWWCGCDCGNIKDVASTALIGGQQQCGECAFQKIKDGDVFGRLVVLGLAYKDDYHTLFFHCKCECGNMVVVRGSSLRGGITQSCGCLQKERTAEAHLKHGKAKSKEYQAYYHMKHRCLDLKCKDYHNYGGRGITICARWLESFENFYADMGNAPSPKHQLDRIDVNGNYEPSNCRWVTAKEQQNNRRNNRHITYKNMTKTVSEWADYWGIESALIAERLYYGLEDDALFCLYDRRFKYQQPVLDEGLLDYIEHADKEELLDSYLIKIPQSMFKNYRPICKKMESIL